MHMPSSRPAGVNKHQAAEPELTCQYCSVQQPPRRIKGFRHTGVRHCRDSMPHSWGPLMLLALISRSATHACMQVQEGSLPAPPADEGLQVAVRELHDEAEAAADARVAQRARNVAVAGDCCTPLGLRPERRLPARLADLENEVITQQ